MPARSLTELFSIGWSVHMRGVIPLDEAPITREKVEDIKRLTDGKAHHIVFIHNWKTGEKDIYAIANEEELQVAHQAVAEARRIFGYTMRIECRARSSDGEIRVGKYVRNLKDITGWRIEESDQTGYFYVFLELEGEDREPGYALLRDVEDALIALSIKNRIGFEIVSLSWGPKYVGQPFAIWVGRSEWVPQEITSDDIRRVAELRSDESEDIFLDVINYYGQVNAEQKIISGFSILEKLFDAPPDKAFNKNEIEQILEIVQGFDGFTKNEHKLSQVRDALNRIFTKTRNERISEHIAELLGSGLEETERRVKKISRLRGQAAHTSQSGSKRGTRQMRSDITQELPWIEGLLLKFLNWK